LAAISSNVANPWVALLLLGALGCTGPKASVQGQVRYGGQLVDKGSISFEPADGKGPTAGGIIDNGSYVVADIPPGSKVVRIRGVRKTGKKKEAGPPFPKGHLVEEEVPFIPAVYNDKTMLTAEIAHGKANEVNFDLKAEP
jgi:hypothetical protein